MAGVEDSVIRKRKNTFHDALLDSSEIAAGELIVSDTVFENGIAHERGAVPFRVIDDGIRGVAGSVDHLEGKRRIGIQTDDLTVHDGFSVFDADGQTERRGEVPFRIPQIIIVRFVCQHRDLQGGADLIYRADMVKVAVSEQDLFDDPTFLPDHAEQFFRLRARINNEAVPGRVINIEETVFDKMGYYGNLYYHKSCFHGARGGT